MSGHDDITMCGYCQRLVFFARLKRSGAFIPLEPEILPIYHAGLVAYNEETQMGLVLRTADCEAENPEEDPPVVQWMAKWRITVHRSHFADRRCKSQRDAAKAAA